MSRTKRHVGRFVTSLAVALLAAGCAKPAEPVAVPAGTEAGTVTGAGTGAKTGAGAVPAAVPAAAAATETAARAGAGTPAPDFSLADLDGNNLSLQSFRGKVVVLEWYNPDCPYVQHAHRQGTLVDAAKRWGASSVILLAINSGAPGKQGADVARNKESKKEFDLPHPILLDPDGKVGKLYGVTRTPEMVVVDAVGNIAFRGAPYEMPDGGEALTADHKRWLDDALTDLVAGKPVAVPEVEPKGCSVKYAN